MIQIKTSEQTTAKDAQMILAILDTHLVALVSQFGRDAIVKGLPQEDKDKIAEALRRWAAQYFPGVEISIEV